MTLIPDRYAEIALGAHINAYRRFVFKLEGGGELGSRVQSRYIKSAVRIVYGFDAIFVAFGKYSARSYKVFSSYNALRVELFRLDIVLASSVDHGVGGKFTVRNHVELDTVENKEEVANLELEGVHSRFEIAVRQLRIDKHRIVELICTRVPILR